MTIPERIQALQSEMKLRGLDAYLVPTADYHCSEYIGAYFKTREYLSGFTGSAGTLVVLQDRADLWTDGRYFLQAEDQLQGSSIGLMRDRQPGVPTIGEFLHDQVPDGGRIGFDGRVMGNETVRTIEKKIGSKGITFVSGEDLADGIWPDRPALSARPVWEPEDCGESREEKLQRVRQALEREQADALLLTALDDIAWLLNLRGDDICYSPVFLSYFLLSRVKATRFVQASGLSKEFEAALKKDGVEPVPYSAVTDALEAVPAGQTILVDRETISYRLRRSIPEQTKVKEVTSPVTVMKAVKSPREQENLILAHVKDGIAVTKFIYWLQHTVGQQRVTELSACAELERLRGEQEGYLGPSFAPILAYGPHGAIIHYEPTAATDAVLEPRGFCLADTGGHYQQGTTDITRTIPLGPLTAEEKRAYTLVLLGHLRLADAVFPAGVTGANLDILARSALWKDGLDYNHGTGHGVGYLLNVHEGPHTIHWHAKNPVPLEAGMVVSDEPGLYLEGKFGIRHENLLLCQTGQETEYGQFLKFCSLTLVPFDRGALDLSLLEPRDKALLNAYHARVCQAIAPALTEEERTWLVRITAPV